MDGQMLFSSGWEWGYWLNDVIAARAAWDPGPAALSPGEAFRRALGVALAPLGEGALPWVDLLTDTAAAQRDLLILGRIMGEPPADIHVKSGQAYLQGFETWDDLSELAARLHLPGAQMTQPARLGLIELSRGGKARRTYEAEVKPLLAEMEETFTGLSERALRLLPRGGRAVWPIAAEITDGLRVNALRARQIYALYNHASGRAGAATLQRARAALEAASWIVAQRERAYRVDPQRVAAWAPNPTAYPFGYLWTTRTLYYWWRDEGKAVVRPLTPCYLNILNPVSLAIGDGLVADLLRALGGMFSLDSYRGCLAEPDEEPTFPPSGLRDAP